MSGNYKPYPNYKASGIEWLGDVPEHWEIISIKNIYTRVKDTEFDDEILLSVYRDYGIIPKSSRNDNYNKQSEDLSPYQLVQVGDLVINKMKAWQGSLGISKYKGIVSPAYYIYRSKNDKVINLNFVHNQIRSLYFIQSYKNFSKGIRVDQWDLDNESFLKIQLYIPLLTEQQQIADFLDREVGKIEALIAKQERLVELLTEKRQAVISHAVTKGLNPNTPMKPSAIDWLGDVPKHWEVISIKRIVNIINGSTPKSDVEDYWDGDIVWVTPSDLSQVRNNYINSSKRTITQSGFYSCGTSLVPENSIILSTRAPIGSLAVNKTVLCTNQGCKSLVFKRESICLFFYYLLLISTEQLNLLGRGSTFLELSSEDLGSFSVPFPSLSEQQQIVDFLDQETKKIDSLIQKSQHMVTLLKERKTALISAAVTGKIDVRD